MKKASKGPVRGRAGGKKRNYARVTVEVIEDALEALAAGMTLSEFCRQPGRPLRRSIAKRIHADLALAERFTAAREQGFDVIAEDVLRIADEDVPVDDRGRVDAAAVQHRKLRADVRLRLLAKWCCARYGDKLQVGGDGGSPIQVMSDEAVMREVMGLLATAKARQLRDPKSRVNGESLN